MANKNLPPYIQEDYTWGQLLVIFGGGTLMSALALGYCALVALGVL